VRVTDRAAALFRRLRRRPPARAGTAVDWRPTMTMASVAYPADARERFVQAGFRPSFFFPHRVHRLPRCGPDGAMLAKRMLGVTDLERLWQLVVFAESPAIDEFPESLFFDRDLLWHEQHFGRVGQVASVTVVEKGRRLHSIAHQSDLVQRISRHRPFKTRVEKVFQGWHHVLLNAIAGFARDRGCDTLMVPTSTLAMEHTDRRRVVKPELFERVYDRAVQHHCRATERDGWWAAPLSSAPGIPVATEGRTETIHWGRTVAIIHDVERGWGHRGIDDAFADRADVEAPAALEGMLAVERQLGVRATYNVVGAFLPEVRDRIQNNGHALAFHSYDHRPDTRQLAACREVDYRIKGYRVPRSRLTTELTNEQLAWHNFEWLASSVRSVGGSIPRLDGRIVKIPVHLDDFALHAGTMSWDGFRRRVLETLQQHDFVAVGLHDCYATHWLPHYASLLREITSIARPRTMDDVAADVYLSAGI